MLKVLYDLFKSTGEVFGFGAFEGFIAYSLIVSYLAFVTFYRNNKSKVRMARRK